MEFKKILGFRFAWNLTLGIILFGSIVFTLGFGVCLMIARQEVSKEVNGKVESQINYLESFVEGQLMRIEDAGYSLGGSLFGKAVRGNGTDGFIELDELSFIRPTPEECYLFLEQFMEANPLVCGIAMEFAPMSIPMSRAHTASLHMSPSLRESSKGLTSECTPTATSGTGGPFPTKPARHVG